MLLNQKRSAHLQLNWKVTFRDTVPQWRTQEFCWGGGFQQIQLRTEDRENGDLGAVAP